ncbi:MAG: CCA tRNA nucleotidyltransferase, partial [Candidatus Nitrosocosmicus sp.]
MNIEINDLIDEILDDCTPTDSEIIHLNNIANKVKDLITNFVSDRDNYGFVKDVVFGGSFAKGTWLKKETDIDIFVKFDSQTDIKDFENYGKEIGLQSLKDFSPYLRYADHPYVEAYVETVKVNVVPCFDVSFGKWKSAADRSPFHTLYVVSSLDNYKKNQVRLLKKFLRSLNVYGAEISRKGFSGYVSEILIVNFGSFISTLDYFSNFDVDKNVIDLDNNLIDADSLKKRFNSFLIILDPVDSNRNLGTAISPLSAGTFIQGSKVFLRNPSNDFFVDIKKIRNADPALIELLSASILITEFKFSFRAPDIIWGQLQKTMNSMSKFIESNGFKIIKNVCFTDERERCVMAFLMESITIPKLYKRIGPDIFRDNDPEKFVKSNSISPVKWMTSDNRLNCLLLRDFIDAREYLKFVFMNKPDLIGIPSGLRPDFLSTVQVYSVDQQ